MSNIKDIAKLAGVSISTVSRVLNNHPYVKDEKRRKVLQIIEELNYQQNVNAIHLVKGKTFMVGVILPYVEHPYFQSIVGGIIKAANSSNFAVVLCPTNYNQIDELKYLEMMKRKQIDGVIICSRANKWEVILPFTEYGSLVSCELAEEIPCAYTDHFDAFSSALNFLIGEGHKSIGYSVARTNSTSSKMRLSAFRDVLAKNNLPINESFIFSDCIDIEDGKRIVKELVQLKERPTALLVNGDEVAAGVLLQVKKEGLSVPADLSIIGFDNQPFSEALELTTIDQHLKEIGEKAFDLFLHGRNQKVCIPFELVIRKTVSKL
ncbi:LacI family DNA-binding transcriptional regulator [Neobacillus sp. NPDC093127]|uniref:LacI family DNA-binding transcriptional regulator n=1 Tax=Neobacillus sp. NPDC093127 TaxID=3364296 RepID=UPI00381E9F22